MAMHRLVHFAAALTAILLPAAAARAEPVTLKFGYPAPMQTATGQVVLAWGKEVEQASHGTLAVQFFPGSSVATFNNVLDRVLNRVIDIGFGVFGEYTKQFPRSDTPSLPFECTRSGDCSAVMWRLYATGVTAMEYGNVKPLSLFTFPTSSLQSTKLVRTADDVKGMKLVVTGRTLSEAATLMGAAPVTLGPQEYFQALQRGVANGVVVSWSGALTFKLDEVSKYHLGVPFGLFPSFVFMNKDSYAVLPAAAKAAIDATTGEKLSRAMGGSGDKASDDAIAKFSALPGHTTVAELPPEEAARWKTILAPITAEWIKNTPDGAKVLETHRALMAKVKGGL
jgi:TRAP-type C4-dicarboxylate transport system substrate-binding protein